jgi:hypothetical protein
MTSRLLRASKNTDTTWIKTVGASLLAKAVNQSTLIMADHRIREQARSHIDCISACKLVCFRDPETPRVPLYPAKVPALEPCPFSQKLFWRLAIFSELLKNHSGRNL